jgi:serine/threonine-protein kinase RsbW
MNELAARLDPVSPDIEAFIDQLEAFFEQHGLPPDLLPPFCLAFDEVLCNVASYSQATRPIEARLWFDDEQVHAEVIDDGLAFDPLQAAEPDTGADLDDRAIGGLGIFLVRRLMDHVAYARHDGRNQLGFAKRLPGAGEP